MPTGNVRRPDLATSEHGRALVRARWGPQRVVRLDGLDPAEREAVIAIVEAKRRATVCADTGVEAAAAGSPEVER